MQTLTTLLAFTRFARPLPREVHLCRDCHEADLRAELAGLSWGQPDRTSKEGDGG